MGAIEETNKRLEIAKNISSQLEGIVQGVLLGGSMSFGQNFSVNEKSDIDMVVVCDKDKAKDLEKTPYFQGHIPKNVLKMFECFPPPMQLPTNLGNFFAFEFTNCQISFFFSFASAFKTEDSNAKRVFAPT